jgi:predicted acetyltransferase
VERTTLARGDEEFAEFARASYSGLIHAAYLLTGDRHTAEDAEFFVVRRHRRHGIGRDAARRMFRRHPGEWLLAFDHANLAAARFWPSVVAAIADGRVDSDDRYPPEVSYPGT